jgi:hypothetical protein
VAPVGPVGPVAPVGPVGPVGPVAPVAPTKFVCAPTQTPLAAITAVVPTVSPFLTTKLDDVAIYFFIQYILLYLNFLYCV